MSRKNILIAPVLALVALVLWFPDAAAERSRTDRTGGSSCNPCSVVELTFEPGDREITRTIPSVRCGEGYFDQSYDPTAPIDCTYKAYDSAEPIETYCFMEGTCYCFEEGNCNGNPRTQTHEMVCPTLWFNEDNMDTENGAVCDVTVTVVLDTGDEILSPLDDSQLTSNSLCSDAYPRDAMLDLGQRVVGRNREVFEPHSDCTEVANEVHEVVRGRLMHQGIAAVQPEPPAPANFWATSDENELISGGCNPNQLQGICQDSGGLWIYADGRELEEELGLMVSEIVDHPETLQCGTDGPPSTCRARDVNGDGYLDAECRCPTCDPATEEFLANGNLYTLTQTAGAPQWTASCEISVP